MKKLYFTMIILMTVTFMMFVGCCCVSRKAQKGAYGEKTASLFQLVMPEKDLYEPVATLPISLLSETSYDFDYNHEYAGFYDVSLITPNMDFNNWYDPKYADFEMSVTISCNKGAIVTHHTGSHSELYGFSGSNYGGVTLFEYSLPAEYPVDQLLHCHLEILKPGPVFVSQYGAAMVQISKSGVE